VVKRAGRAFLDPRLAARTTRRLERPQLIWAQVGVGFTSYFATTWPQNTEARMGPGL